MHLWKDRIHESCEEMPLRTEDQVAWKVVEEISIKARNSLMPVFEAHRDQRQALIQNSPPLYRDTKSIVGSKPLCGFHALPPTLFFFFCKFLSPAGIEALNEATYRHHHQSTVFASRFRSASSVRLML